MEYYLERGHQIAGNLRNCSMEKTAWPEKKKLLFSYVPGYQFCSFKTSNYGETASVQFSILDGDLPINVTWLLNSQAIDIFLDISLSRIGKRVNVLTIESVADHHAGNYSCRAQSKAGVTENFASLIVNAFSFGDEPLNFGEPVSVHFTISGGDLPVLLIWTLNRHPLVPNLDIFMEKGGKRINSLMIDVIDANHAGVFTCIATNSAGKTEHSAELVVNGWLLVIEIY